MLNENPQPDMQAQPAPNTPMIDGEELQGLLFQRLESMTPEEYQILDKIFTPENLPVLFKLLPELGILFERGSQMQNMEGNQQQMPPSPAPNMQQMPKTAPRGLVG